MSPKRSRRTDERWTRHGGLFLPRRGLALPTRRFVQKHGTAQDCCGIPEGCYIWSGGTRPASVQIAISGVSDGWCDECDGHNRTVEADFQSHTDDNVAGFCTDSYSYVFGSLNSVNATFFHYYNSGVVRWALNVNSSHPSTGCPDMVGSAVTSLSVGNPIWYSPFSLSSVYSASLGPNTMENRCLSGTGEVTT